MMTMTRKTRNGATVSMTINGTVYSGRMSNPAGAYAPDQWVSADLIRGISTLPLCEQTSVYKSMRASF
jgi:hypothetical protein